MEKHPPQNRQPNKFGRVRRNERRAVIAAKQAWLNGR